MSAIADALLRAAGRASDKSLLNLITKNQSTTAQSAPRESKNPTKEKGTQDTKKTHRPKPAVKGALTQKDNHQAVNKKSQNKPSAKKSVIK